MAKFSIVAQLSGLDFGLKALSYREVRDITLQCERLGFDAVVLSDHLFLGPDPYPEIWLTLAALALQTKKLRLGPHVTCNLLRRPSLTAKMASTLDEISGGRLHFGLGACGWGLEWEHPAYGIPEHPASVRIGMLREATLIVKRMWSEPKATFRGKYYKIEDAPCEPKPLQKPLSVWLGGSGKRFLKVAAEVADGWDTGFARIEDYKGMLATFESFCDEFERNPKTVTRGFSCYWTIIGADRKEYEERKQRLLPQILANKEKHRNQWIRSLRVEEYLQRRQSIAGTPEDCIRQIGQLVDLGVEYFFLSFATFPDTSALELFASEVMPHFKK